jgi:hypothetical protein
MTRAREIASQGGLVLISSTTIGSAVSFVLVSNAFNATYDSYRIVLTNSSLASAGATFHWQLALNGTASSTGYSYGIAAMDYFANAFSYQRGVNTNIIISGMAVGAGNTVSTNFDILNPFNAKQAGYGGMGAGIHEVATSYNDLRVSSSTGTMTGGTLKVYGYK